MFCPSLEVFVSILGTHSLLDGSTVWTSTTEVSPGSSAQVVFALRMCSLLFILCVLSGTYFSDVSTKVACWRVVCYLGDRRIRILCNLLAHVGGPVCNSNYQF